MSLIKTSKRRKRGLYTSPAPLDMTLLGVPDSPNLRKTIIVSAARPSIKESVAALGLNYSLSSGGIPDLPSDPTVSPSLPRVLDSLFLGSSPNSVLNTSSCSSHYTTTDTSAGPSEASFSTCPPNLARPRTLSLPSPSVIQKSAGAAVSSNPDSPVTPPLLTPAPVRPVRRWGMAVFPQNNVIRRISSAPSSPTFVNNSPASPTSPVGRKDSKRISDAFSLMNPFVASLPQVMDVSFRPSTLTQTLPVPQMGRSIPPKPNSPSLVSTLEDPAPDGDAALSPSTSKASRTSWGKSNPDTTEEPNLQAKAEVRHFRSPTAKTNRTVSHHKHTSTHQRESSIRGRNRRLILKRDSGAPFATVTEAVTDSTSPSTRVEWAEMKEGQRDTRRWSASRKFLQTPTRRARATVVMIRRGRERVEEKDIVAVIPQLRDLKVPKRMRL